MPDIFQEIRSDLTDFTNSAGARLDKLQKQVDSLDMKLARPTGGAGGASNPGGSTPLVEQLTKAENLELLRKGGRVMFTAPSLLEVKAITSSGITTPASMGVIADTGRFPYGAVRRALATIPTADPAVFRVKETSNGFVASPQSESNAKQESTATLSAETIAIKTIATWVGVTKQAMDDVPGLAAFLNSSLVWALEKKVEQELIAGDGTGEHLTGFSAIATAFDTTILSTADGWNRADLLRAAMVQMEEAGRTPTFFVVSPRDWYQIESEKDSLGRYLVGDPRAAMNSLLWTTKIIPSAACATGTFYAVDGSRVVIRQRMESAIDVSFEHSDYFTKNMVAIRCEERLALVSLGDAAVITGSFVTSPA